MRTAWALLLFFALAFSAGCSKDASGTARKDAPKQPPVPVTVGVAVEKTVPVQLRAIGNVEAFSTVTVKSQVEGQLTTVHFKEGQEVKEGDMLFTIDPRPFQVALKQAQANLAKDRALLATARKQVDRYGSVASKGYVSQDQFDQISSNAAALEATVQADEAAVENARLKLEYCSIKSPITGVAGGIKVNRGNIVKADDNDRPLVLINQLKPVYLSFMIPERYLPRIRQRMAENKLQVTAVIPSSGGTTVAGELAFIENTVDTNTGSIQLKAAFANENKTLWPGQFVNVTLTLASQPNTVVVPSQAIQTGQQGQYVFVVKEDFTVDYRLIGPGESQDGETIITKGVSAGEKVVTDGQLRLAAGSPVKVVDANGKQ